ncbi:MAG: hypothetical protein ACO34E_18925, partial [Limisphaerales bacterium]
ALYALLGSRDEVAFDPDFDSDGCARWVQWFAAARHPSSLCELRRGKARPYLSEEAAMDSVR